MGLLPPVLIGALLVVAFAFSSQQRLAIASHAPPMPARQLAYLMRAHHQAAVALKVATPSLDTVTDVAPPTMTVAGDYTFISCISGNYVATGLFVIGDTTTLAPLTLIGAAESNAVVTELKRQSVLSPELGQVGSTPWAVGNGSSGAQIAPVTGIGLVGDAALAGIPCPMPNEAPVIVTQVLP